MPKVIVLHAPGSETALTLANAGADGARRNRFLEVDVRALGADIHGYDGAVVIVSDADDAAVDAALHDVAHVGNHVVVGIVGSDEWPERLRRMDSILITSRESEPAARAAAVGQRVGKVAGWVRHGLGHEAERTPHVHHHHK